MSAPAWLIRELEQAIQNGSPQFLTTLVTRIGGLFLARTDFNTDHVRLFDQVLSRLLMDAVVEARLELARRLAPLDNAPLGVVRLLARDNAINVAGLVLEYSPRLTDDDLVDIGASKGEAHLLAISRRASLAEPVSELLVRRGGREVLRNVAGNCRARLSHDSFFALVERAADDAVLAEKVGSRPDLPPYLFSDLLSKAVKPDMKFQSLQGPAPQRTSETLRDYGKLEEARVLELAKNGRYQDLIAALARLCAVPIEVVERLMGSRRTDPVLILCKSVGWSWETARAVLIARPLCMRMSGSDVDSAFAEFQRLPSSAARRVRQFWQFTLSDGEAVMPE
jgi:uncharacterized protein (DUF2336 family)